MNRGKAASKSTESQAGVSGGPITRSPEHTWGHTKPFGDQYFEGTLSIFEAIKRTEMPAIADLAGRMASVLSHGGNVWMQAKQGHMCRFEFDQSNRGNPGILRSNTEWDDTDYENMRKGDILVTNYVNENVVNARKQGVFIAEVTVCYQDNPSFPRGFVKPSPLGILQQDVADMIVDSHVPYEQGLVTCPEIPEMKLCPSSANALAALFWMMQAEAANRAKNPGTSGSDKAAAVIDTLIDRVTAACGPQRDLISQCAPTVAKAIGGGGHYYVTSGHGGVQCEATGVASGPMMTNAFRRDMRKGDIHLLAAIESDSEKILSEARKSRDLGMFVVSIAPAGAQELRSLSDVFIDNLSPEDALVEIEGYDEKVGAIGGIMNNVLMWVFTAQFVDEMVRRGWIPWFWMGFYQEGGNEYCDAVKQFFRRQGF